MREDPAASRSRFLLVVARPEPKLYEALTREVSRYANIQVVLDQRRGQRRRGLVPIQTDQRRADRRTRPAVEAQLRARGWVVVRC